MKNDCMALIEERTPGLREKTGFTCPVSESLTGYAIIAADLAGNKGICSIYGRAPIDTIGKQTVDMFLQHCACYFQQPEEKRGQQNE